MISRSISILIGAWLPMLAAVLPIGPVHLTNALICGAVHPGHAHTPERQGKDRRTVRAEPTRLMVGSWCHQSTLDRLATLWQGGTA